MCNNALVRQFEYIAKGGRGVDGGALEFGAF